MINAQVKNHAKSVAAFRAFVASMGATLDADQEVNCEAFVVDAPLGKHWSGNGGHSICEPFGNCHGHTWRREAVLAAVTTMLYGLDDCDPACETCEDRRREESDAA